MDDTQRFLELHRKYVAKVHREYVANIIANSRQKVEASNARLQALGKQNG